MLEVYFLLTVTFAAPALALAHEIWSWLNDQA